MRRRRSDGAWLVLESLWRAVASRLNRFELLSLHDERCKSERDVSAEAWILTTTCSTARSWCAQWYCSLGLHARRPRPCAPAPANSPAPSPSRPDPSLHFTSTPSCRHEHFSRCRDRTRKSSCRAWCRTMCGDWRRRARRTTRTSRGSSMPTFSRQTCVMDPLTRCQYPK